MKEDNTDKTMIFYGTEFKTLMGRILCKRSNDFEIKDCKSDCSFNLDGVCTSDEDDLNKIKEMTFDNSCPSYLSPDWEESINMRSYLRNNIAKLNKSDVETVYCLLKGLNERRIKEM